MLPTEWKRSALVWDALLTNMPLTAMLRSLAQITSVGLLVPGSPASKLVVSRLTDASALTKARVHPLAVLARRRFQHRSSCVHVSSPARISIRAL